MTTRQLAQEHRYAVAFLVAYAGAIALLAATRRFPTFGVETDFISGFVPDAERLVSGEAPEFADHPPAYVVVLAAVYAAIGDWFQSGLVISVISSVVVLGAAYSIFALTGTRSAAWGALVGCVTSQAFLYHSATASSDLFFLALFYVTLLQCLVACRRSQAGWWGAAGVSAALTMLARSNGISHVATVLAPLLLLSSGQQRRKSMGWVLAGCAFPLAVWAVLAAAIDRPVIPQGNAANVALMFFSDDFGRFSSRGDAYLFLETKFRSISDVVTYDPIRLFVGPARRAVSYLQRDLSGGQLVNSILAAFAVPGLLLWAFDRLDRRRLWLLGMVGGQIALLGFFIYADRLRLFLVPLIGAGAGYCWARVHSGIGHRIVRVAVTTGLAALLALVVARGVLDVVASVSAADVELGSAVPAIREAVAQGATIVARKDHVAFLVGTDRGFFPDVDTLAELKHTLAGLPGDSIYLYIGSAERRMRVSVSNELARRPLPNWLVLVVSDESGVPWSLYKVIR